MDNNDNSILFFKIWRNVVLNKIIFKHLMMYNLVSFPVDLDSSLQPFIKNNLQYVKSLFVKVDDMQKDAKQYEIYEIGEKLNDLPKDIESIIFYQTNFINYSLSNLELPKSLYKLIIPFNFDLPLDVGSNRVFSNLTILEFGSNFNQKIDENILPNTLKKLKFGKYFNQELKNNVLPKYLKTIIFGYFFDKSLDNLPQLIKEIKFPSNSLFNKLINSNKLPLTLKKLSLPSKFNISLINGILPIKLKNLKISNFGAQINDNNNNNNNKYNEKSKYLKLKVYNKNGNLSSNDEILKILKLNSKIIPSSVRNVTIFFNTFQDSLQGYYLSSQFSSINLNLTKSNLLKYWLYKETSKLLLDKFEKIKSIKVNIIENNYKLDYHSKSCLSDLIYLNLNEFDYNFYSKPVKDFKVFTKLKCLRIGNYNSTIKFDTLPPSLEVLELGCAFKQPIHMKWLPISLKYIIVLNNETPISINSLPPSLESIWILDNHYQLNDFKFFIPLIGKLKIVDQDLIWKMFNKIFKKKYEFYLY
ncbi:hypothetical protein ACTFIW_002490 [Dictyostelium discoideum]